MSSCMASIPSDLMYKTLDEFKTFGFDFQTEGAVKQGATLSSPIVTVDPASGLIVGTPEVLTGDFMDGGQGKKIPSGKGVKVLISGGNVGRWLVSCTIRESTNNDLLECPGRLEVLLPST